LLKYSLLKKKTPLFCWVTRTTFFESNQEFHVEPEVAGCGGKLFLEQGAVLSVILFLIAMTQWPISSKELRKHGRLGGSNQ
jgi:hypothetical protein